MHSRVAAARVQHACIHVWQRKCSRYSPHPSPPLRACREPVPVCAGCYRESMVKQRLRSGGLSELEQLQGRARLDKGVRNAGLAQALQARHDRKPPGGPAAPICADASDVQEAEGS